MKEVSLLCPLQKPHCRKVEENTGLDIKTDLGWEESTGGMPRKVWKKTIGHEGISEKTEK